MNIKTKRKLFKAAHLTSLYIVVIGVAFIILLPVYFLFTLSFMSDYEAYNEWPWPWYPHFKVKFLLEKENNALKLSVYKPVDKDYLTIANTNDIDYIVSFVKRKTNCNLKKDFFLKQVNLLNKKNKVYFTLNKDFFANYILFFRLKPEAMGAFYRSIYTAIATIFISLLIGGLGGYAFARYNFKYKDTLKVSILFVRMFPAVATAIPAAIILGQMGLYDKPIGLSFIYSIGSIGLTTWITASIFMSIPVELEEAAMIFGTSKVQAFLKITLPLALPGLTACAMYAFVGSWNEYAQAIILTQFNPTFPVVIFEYVLGAQGMEHLATAGGLILAIPALVFYFFIRKYILQMWGEAKM